MKRFATILFTLILALAIAGPVMAEGDQWPTSVSKFVSVAGDNVTAFTAKSGLKTVIDSGILVDEDDADSALYIYTGLSTTATATDDSAVADTGAMLTSTASSSPARTGDIFYEVTRADDPMDSTFIFHGVITGYTFSDTGNSLLLVRAASDSEAVLSSGSTVNFARPLVGTRGTGATSIMPYTVTDDAAIVYFAPQNVAAAYTASGANMLNAYSVFPVGEFGKDYIIRWDTGGAIVDGETKLLTGHYETKK